MIVAKIREFVKTNLNNILLFIVVVLFVLLAFAGGYIVAKYQDRAPIIWQQ